MNNNIKESGGKDIQERAFLFACRIVKLYQFLAKQKSGMEVLGRHVLRSGTSVGANLEEAKAGQSKADFISKCNIALKEARETHCWLRLFEKTKVISVERLSELTKESNELVAILYDYRKKRPSF